MMRLRRFVVATLFAIFNRFAKMRTAVARKPTPRSTRIDPGTQKERS
jgi:hypothetical protein